VTDVTVYDTLTIEERRRARTDYAAYIRAGGYRDFDTWLARYADDYRPVAS